MECYCYLGNIQDLPGDGKTPCERGFGESFNGPMIPFGALIVYHPISPKDQTRVHQFGKKVLPGIFLACALIARGNLERKGDVLVADMEDLEKLHASYFYPRRINAKEILIRQNDDDFIFPFADSTAKLSRRDYEFQESILRRDPTAGSEDFNRELIDEPGVTLKPVPIFGRSKVTSPIVITMNLRFNSTCRRKNKFQFT